jgi:hypothetical protein
MADPMDSKSDMPEQKPSFQLNPEALQNVAPADLEAIGQVKCVVREVPWPKRFIEGIAHHLAGEFAGFAIGTCLALSGFGYHGGPKSFEPGVCIAAVTAARADKPATFRLVLCPLADDPTPTRLTGDGSG